MTRISASDIARAAKGKRLSDGGFLIRCPVPQHGQGNGDRNPSCTVHDGTNGLPVFHCFAGCNWRDILDAVRERGWSAAGPISRPSANPMHSREIHHLSKDYDTTDLARRIWAACQSSADSPAERYLVEARGILDPPLSRLRFHPRVWHSGARTHLPALIAPIGRVGDNVLQGIQAIYLHASGSSKADVEPAKRTLGRLKGGGVWLADVADTMVVAEGIETALSVQSVADIPAVATLSAHTMASLILPHQVRTVVIAADPGDVGERFAYVAAERWSLEGRMVRIALPRRQS